MMKKKFQVQWIFSGRLKTKSNMTFKFAAGFAVFCLLMAHGITVFAEQKLGTNEYVVLEEVYAFSSPEKLLQKVDTLVQDEFPFVMGVMPVYQHTDYPAMTEFTEVVRYAQSKGARILLHFPIVQKENAEPQEIIAILKKQQSMYEEFGIYPRGILMGEDEQEYNWMTEELEDFLPVFKLENPGVEYYVRSLKETLPLLRTEELPEIAYSYKAKEIPDDFDFQRGILQDFSFDLAQQNRVLIGVGIVGIVVFTGMIAFARKRNKKDFFRKDEKDERD